MSILIKGMEMPKNCNDCPLNYDSIDCMVADIALREKGGGDFLFEHDRSSDCPLVPVPPHGRLIDADSLEELCKIMADKCDGIGTSIWEQFRTTVEWCPTVIEAEGGE